MELEGASVNCSAPNRFMLLMALVPSLEGYMSARNGSVLAVAVKGVLQLGPVVALATVLSMAALIAPPLRSPAR
jgi:hypothetical protein